MLASISPPARIRCLQLLSAALLVLLTGAPDAVQAQPAFLVKDIRQATEDSFSSYGPDNSIVRTSAGTAFFLGTEPSTGRELWKTDGTAAGTLMVKDISTESSTPRELVNVAGTLYFVAFDNPHGGELWKSDGTEAGTQMVADLCPGTCYYSISSLTAVGTRLFFKATTPANGTELWTSDGTPGGTFMPKDIELGAASSSPYLLTPVGGQLYFYATQSSTGGELWKSDGTTSGTELVLDINPGPASSGPISAPNSMVDFLGTLLFSAIGPGGTELWRSNGTAAGTFRVKDINPGPVGSSPYVLVRIGDRVFLNAWVSGLGRELWKTDGTEAGTELVMDIAPGPDSSEPTDLAEVMGTAFFIADDGVKGRELWRSNGTATSTTLVKDLNPGPQGSSGSQLMSALGMLFLSADDGTGNELWKSDGTAAGTSVLEINPGSSSEPMGLAEVNGAVLFIGFGGLAGRELWRSDGTPGGTYLVRDINTIIGSSFPGHSLTANLEYRFDAVDLNGRLLFGAADGTHGEEPWTSDGTLAGTAVVKDMQVGGWGSLPSELTKIGGTAYFQAFTSSSYGIWRTNGTAGGTALVAEASSFFGGKLPLVDLNGIPYFTGWVLPSGPGGLWKTDGTPAGTVLVKAFPAGLDSLVDAGGALFFIAIDFLGTTKDLWTSDGTAAGTQMVANLCSGSCPFQPEFPLTPVGRRVFFGNESPGAGLELWSSDGTPVGTGMVKDIWPGPGTSYPSDLVSFRGKLFFSAAEDVAGPQLWRSDGTTAGTQMVKDTDPRPGWLSALEGLTVVGDTLFFSAADGINGQELWKSDGTTLGTVLVRDIEPGAGSSQPENLARVGGSLLFSAETSAHGREPWWSAGTQAATSLIQDIDPGSSDPLGFVASGELVYFAASQSVIGTELWAVPLSEVTISSLSVDDVAISEGDAGSTISAFTVRLSAPSKQTVTVTYATEDRTAVAGIDYFTASGSLTFPPGTTALEVPVTILGDTIGEVNETFVLTLSAAVNATINDPDATGSILDDDASGFHTIASCRVADTRSPVDGPTLAANAARTFAVVGRCGIPASAKAVAVNVTVVNPSDFGDLRLFPAGLSLPGSSSLNFRAGGTRANNAVVHLGIDGRIAIQCDMPVGSSGTTHLVVDVTGYFE